MKIFSELQENATVVCATHDYGILPQTARILRIKDGKVVEDRTGGGKKINNDSPGHYNTDFLGHIVYFNHCTDYKNKERKGKNS